MQEDKEEKCSKEADDCEDKFRVYSSIAFMVVVIVVGVPMWWKTTEVYRVPLPYKDIKNLGHVPIKASLSIAIFTFDSDHSRIVIDELKSHYQNNEIWDIKFIQISNIENARNFKTPASLETQILKVFNVKPGDFLIYEWPKLLEEDILITSDRSALITSTTTTEKIIQFLELYILQTYKIQNILDEEKYGIKSSPPQREYDVLISVFNPFPEKLNVKWNIRLASEVYLKPFFESVNQVSNFKLKTQWKYQVAFDFPLKQIKDNSTAHGHYYAISKDTLPHIITSIEKNLGQSISDNFCINIIVYIPPCHISPLYIHDHNGRVSTHNNTDSFISPNWGSVIIYNPPTEGCLWQQKQGFTTLSFHISTNEVMQTVLFHLQKLLDIDSNVHLNGIKLSDNEQLAPRKWEYDAYIRRSAINHIFTANRTLRSLIQLLDDISYIVINDDVGKAVSNAHDNIIHATKCLLSGQLMNASEYAKEAFTSSEKAFFDASLLAQLYFPDEQKYAVYIPLFLPIIVPVITSIAALKKYYKKSPDEKFKTS